MPESTLPLPAPAMLALCKELSRQTKDVTLEPGHYDVDERVELTITGTVVRKPDVEASPAVQVPVIELVACCLECAGCSRERARKVITKALPQVLAGYTPKDADRTRDAEDLVDAFKERVKAEQAKETRAGPTQVQVTVAFQPL